MKRGEELPAEASDVKTGWPGKARKGQERPGKARKDQERPGMPRKPRKGQENHGKARKGQGKSEEKEGLWWKE